MSPQELKECIDRVEKCADDAKRAVQAGGAPGDLRQAVDALHQHASQAKHDAGAQPDESAMRGAIMQIEQAADRAMQACRSAGTVDSQLQQAVQRAHEEASSLKKKIQAGTPA